MRGLHLVEDTVRKEIEGLREEMIAFLQELLRIPTVNPPGEHYRDCALMLRRQLDRFGYTTALIPAEGHPHHSARHPRVNVLGRLEGGGLGPALHFNGHIDVVPAGSGWNREPFGGSISEGKIYGRGASDQKSGIAASLFAIEALRRAGIRLRGAIEQSGTVDEETGGFAGMGYLVENGHLDPKRTGHVIITEPLNFDRVCIGHRGVYWFRVTTFGAACHGSMPFLGASAIDRMNRFIHSLRESCGERFSRLETSLPVDPPEARHPTLNINSIHGGQPDGDLHAPCVADRCAAVFDRRFLPEEDFEGVRNEVVTELQKMKDDDPAFRYSLDDLMVVDPVRTREDSPLVKAVLQSIREVVGREGTLVASPGTYDQKHVMRAGRIENCVAYGPGALRLAHQRDEYCGIGHLVQASQVMALSAIRLLGMSD